MTPNPENEEAKASANKMAPMTHEEEEKLAHENIAKIEIEKGKSGGPGNASGSIKRGDDDTHINE